MPSRHARLLGDFSYSKLFSSKGVYSNGLKFDLSERLKKGFRFKFFLENKIRSLVKDNKLSWINPGDLIVELPDSIINYLISHNFKVDQFFDFGGFGFNYARRFELCCHRYNMDSSMVTIIPEGFENLSSDNHINDQFSKKLRVNFSKKFSLFSDAISNNKDLYLDNKKNIVFSSFDFFDLIPQELLFSLEGTFSANDILACNVINNGDKYEIAYRKILESKFLENFQFLIQELFFRQKEDLMAGNLISKFFGNRNLFLDYTRRFYFPRILLNIIDNLFSSKDYYPILFMTGSKKGTLYNRTYNEAHFIDQELNSIGLQGMLQDNILNAFYELDLHFISSYIKYKYNRNLLLLPVFEFINLYRNKKFNETSPISVKKKYKNLYLLIIS